MNDKFLAAEDKLKEKVDVVCEATSYEQLCLWQEFKDLGKWEQDNIGLWKTIGHVDTVDGMPRPVSIMFDWNTLHRNDIKESRRVVFWEAISSIVDRDMIDAWMKEVWPDAYRTGAGNFENIWRH